MEENLNSTPNDDFSLPHPNVISSPNNTDIEVPSVFSQPITQNQGISFDDRPIGGTGPKQFTEDDMYPKETDIKKPKKPFMKKGKTLDKNAILEETPEIIEKPSNITNTLDFSKNHENAMEETPEIIEKPSNITNTLDFSKNHENVMNSLNETNEIQSDSIQIQAKPNLLEDDRPIGGGGGQKLQFDPKELDNEPIAETKKSDEPLINRIKSKVWKIRQEAFEELSNLLKTCENNVFFDYSEILPKSIIDSNPAAQEKALSAFQAFLTKYPLNKVITLDYNDIVKTMIDKCIGPGKGNVKSISNDILCILFENSIKLNITNQIIEGIISCLSHKNQKTVCSAVQAIIELLSNFGAKKLMFLKPFFNEIEKLASSTTASIRNEAMNFYKEGYKWLGEPVIRPFITNLKKAQIDELDKFFAENPSGKVNVRRQSNDENIAEKTTINQDIVGNIDPYDIVDAVDVMQKFNENWCEKVLNLAKWTEKKEFLEELYKGANVVKITPNVNSSNFSAMMAMLKKLLNDANVNVTLMSVKILGVMAKALRKNLTQNCKTFFPLLLEKVKDKKTALIEEVKQTLDNFLYCIVIDDVIEELKEILSDKGSPLVKLHTLYWIDRYIDKKVFESKGTNKYLLKSKNNMSEILPSMKKLSDDGNGEIRDAVLVSLGKIVGVYGDAILGDFQSKLNNVKLQKLTDSASKMNIVKANEKKVNKDEEESKFLGKTTNMLNKEAKETNKDNNGKPPKSLLIKSGTQKTLTSKEKGAVLTKTANLTGSQSIKSLGSHPDDDNFIYITADEAEEALKTQLPEKLLKNLSMPTWKEKFEALQEISNSYEDVFKDPVNLENFVILMKSKLKDWKESNLNINKEFQLFLHKILQFSEKPLNKRIFCLISGFFLEKLSDNKKFTDIFNEMTPLLLETVNPKYIVLQLMNLSNITDASKKPNLKTLTELCLLLNKIVNLVTMSYLPLKPLLDFSKLCISNTNQPLRAAGLTLIKTIYMYTGKELLKFLNDLNPQVTKTVNMELENTGILKESEKHVKIQFSGEFLTELGEKGINHSKIENPLDTLPRNDISNDVNKVLKKLNDPDWKVRREGIDNLDSILANNNYRVSMNGLLDLITVLKARLIEKNKNLSKGFILYTGKLCESVGKDIKPHVKTLLIPLMSNLSDKQGFIRSDTLTSMDKFAEVIGPEIVINIGVSNFLANESPEMRGELLNWILKNQECLNKCDLKIFTAVLLNCLIDRNKDVRAASELLFEKVINIIGISEFRVKLQDFKPAVVQQLKPIFDKYASLVTTNNMNNIENNNNNTKKEGIRSNNPKKAGTVIIQSQMNNNNEANYSMKNEAISNNTNKSFKVFNNNFNNNNNNNTTTIENEPIQLTKTLIDEPSNKGISIKYGNLIADSTITSSLKTRRVIDEMNHPWSMEEISDDLVSELHQNLKKLIVEELAKRMFSLDFKKHLEAMELLKKACLTESDNIKEISDLLIKWCFIRVWGNTNNLIIGNILHLLKILLNLLAEKSYPLFDFEANILLGLLKETLCNDPQAKTYIEEIHDYLTKIYPEEKIVHYWLVFYKKSIENENKLRENIIDFFICRFNVFSVEDLYSISQIPELSGSMSFMNKLLGCFNRDILKAYGFNLIEDKKETSMYNNNNNCMTFNNNNNINNTFEHINITQEQHDIYSGKKQEIQNKTQEIQSKYKMLRERTHELREKAIELQQNSSNSSKEQINYNFNFNQIIVDSSKLTEQSQKTPKKPLISNNNIGNFTEETFFQMTRNLKEGSITKKIDSLLMINDITTSEKDEIKLLLKGNADILASTLLEVLKDSFDKSKATPNQFIHYFLNILHKVFSLKIFIGNISRELLFDFTEEMVIRLLTEDEEAKNINNSNNTFDFVKLLNSIMLRMLENANLNEIYIILLDLLIKYRKKAGFNTKTMGLIIKCVLKLTKNFENSINELHVDVILLKCHEYLTSFNYDAVKQNEDVGAKTFKTIVNELVKVLGEGIWDPYMAVRDHSTPDQYIQKWILMIMKPSNQSNPLNIASSANTSNIMNEMNNEPPSLKNIPLLKTSSTMQFNPDNNNKASNLRHISPFLQRNYENEGKNNSNSFVVAPYFKDDSDIRKVIEKIKKNENFENSLNFLTDYLETHPGFNLLPYFHECPQNFIDYITESIERIKQQRCIGSEKTLFENRNYSKNFINTSDIQQQQQQGLNPTSISQARLENFTKTAKNLNNNDYENIQNKINQIKLRYGNIVKSNNENEETPIIPNENPYGQDMNETLKELNMLNNNKESVLQKINEMKNKIQFNKK